MNLTIEREDLENSPWKFNKVCYVEHKEENMAKRVISGIIGMAILLFVFLRFSWKKIFPALNLGGLHRTLCFPGSSDGKGSACNARDLGLISGLGIYPGEGNGNPLHYSCLEKAVDSPRGHKESDMTEGLTLSFLLISYDIY